MEKTPQHPNSRRAIFGGAGPQDSFSLREKARLRGNANG
jgi:hypothetical protein